VTLTGNDMTPERETQFETTQAALANIASIDPQLLARKELSSEINFTAAVEPATEMLDILKQLHQRDLSRLSTSMLQYVANHASRFQKFADSVKAFTLSKPNPKEECDALINQFVSQYDSMIQELALPLAFTATQATDYNRLEREATGFHQQLKKQLDTSIAELKTKQSEADKALTAIKDQAAKLGVTSNAVVFRKTADEHKEHAAEWRRLTKRMTIGTFATALASLAIAFVYVPPTTAAAIQIVVSKLIVLSTLTLFTVWCANNYRSEKHNETLYRHRTNALITFQTFIEGSSDPRVKDAILLHAAQTAFSPRPTGFESSEGEHQHVKPVVEILGKSIPTGG